MTIAHDDRRRVQRLEEWRSSRYGGVGCPRMPARKRRVQALALHMTTGGASSDRPPRVAQWFDTPAAAGATHYVCSDTRALRFAADDRNAPAANAANQYTISIEGCGSADATAETWRNDPYYRGLRTMLASALAWLSERHAVELVHLTDEQLKAIHAGDTTITGVIGHVQVTRALRSGSHYCPGPAFPYADILDEARSLRGRVAFTLDWG